MAIPTPEQIESGVTGPRRAIMEIALREMSAQECTLFFSLLTASFAARELGPPPVDYSRRPGTYSLIRGTER